MIYGLSRSVSINQALWPTWHLSGISVSKHPSLSVALVLVCIGLQHIHGDYYGQNISDQRYTYMQVDVPSYTSPADVEELVSAQLTAFSEAINGTTYTYGHQNVLSTRGMLTASPAYYLKYPMLASRLQETNGTAPLVLGVVMEAATSGCVNNMLE